MIESAVQTQRPAAFARPVVNAIRAMRNAPNEWALREVDRVLDQPVPAFDPVPSTRLRGDARISGLAAGSLGQDQAGPWTTTLLDETDALATDATAWNLGEMVVVREVSPRRRLSRSALMARADQMDHYQLLVSFASGTVTVDADGESLDLGRGEPLLLDLARPVDITLAAGLVMQAFVPREMLEELLPGPRDLHAVRLVGASATVLAEYLRSLTTCLPEMAAAQAPHAATASLHMLAAALAATPERTDRARPRLESPLLRQACRYIELHLSESGLAASHICAALKISRASLYRLFESYGGVSHHIRERRLARIHEVLCESKDRRSLARIAEDHGFENSAHFSRAFRQRYGYCPRDAIGMNGGEQLQVAAVAASADPLTQWLRSLRG